MPKCAVSLADTPVPTAGSGGTILGIDPGLQRTGYAVLSPGRREGDLRVIEAGVIRLPRERSLAERLVELECSLQALLDGHRPATLVCEELYAHYKHPRTAILMGHARGVILLAAARAGLEVIPVSATNVKKLLTGSGHASKRQIQLAVTATLKLPVVPEPNDVADALAIALCGLRLRTAQEAAEVAQRRARS